MYSFDFFQRTLPNFAVNNFYILSFSICYSIDVSLILLLTFLLQSVVCLVFFVVLKFWFTSLMQLPILQSSFLVIIINYLISLYKLIVINLQINSFSTVHSGFFSFTLQIPVYSPVLDPLNFAIVLLLECVLGVPVLSFLLIVWFMKFFKAFYDSSLFSFFGTFFMYVISFFQLSFLLLEMFLLEFYFYLKLESVLNLANSLKSLCSNASYQLILSSS